MLTLTHLYPNSHTILARKKIRKALDLRTSQTLSGHSQEGRVQQYPWPRGRSWRPISSAFQGTAGPIRRSQALSMSALGCWRSFMENNKELSSVNPFFCKYSPTVWFFKVNEDCLCHTRLENARMIIMIVIIIKLCKKICSVRPRWWFSDCGLSISEDLLRNADPGATFIPHESETLWMDPALGAVTSPGLWHMVKNKILW